jgi:hypothetical protein
MRDMRVVEHAADAILFREHMTYLFPVLKTADFAVYDGSFSFAE